MKRLLSTVTVVGLLLGGLTALAPSAAASSTNPTVTKGSITWGTCDDPDLADAGAVCARLAVPLDYAHPHGTKISLAVSMVRHTVPDADYQGVMLVNPGGPGGSGLIYSILGQFVPNGAGDAYDWIGFDPRGVGSSSPSISCIPDYFAGPRPDYIPFTRAIEKVWLARSRSYARACGADAGRLLDHMTTIDAAKDVDQIRRALGQQQINYYGFSYGTYLGQVYSTMFPNRVRRMVFDGTVNPTRVWYKANLDQDFAFEKTEKIFFGWVARYDDVYHLGTTEAAVEKRYYAEQDLLRKDPAGGVVGPDEWADIMLLAGYYQITWTDVAGVFSAWANDRDVDTLVQAYEDAEGVGDDNGFAVYNAVQCTDVQWPPNYSTWRRDNWRVYAQAPFLTWGNAWFNAPCLFWPAAAHRPLTVDGSRVDSLLMINETLDAATPYPGSLVVRKLYPGARLIAEPGGTTHAGSLFGNACVDDQIADYLATGALPDRRPGNRADAICAPLPQPVPETASATAASAGATRLALATRSLSPLMRH